MRAVLCCVADDAAFAQTQRACSEVGFRVERVHTPDASEVPAGTRVVALVHDLVAVSHDSARDAVARFRHAFPARPVLLYVGPERVELASEIGQHPGVVACVSSTTGRDDVPVLSRMLRGLLIHQPERLIQTLVHAVCDNPSGTLTRFIATLAARLETGTAGGALRPSAIAEKSRVPLWSLRRECRAARLPRPRDLLRWLTLLTVIDRAVWDGVSVAEAARTMGISDQRVTRLRADLLPAVPKLSRASASAALTAAVIGFARACGCDRQRAEQLAKRFAN